MWKKLLSLCMALALCLSLLPATALAADGVTVYVGGVALTSTNGATVYAKTDRSGNVSQEGATDNDYNIMWDGSTLTLKDAYITNWAHNDSYNHPVEGAAIGVANSSGDAELTIQLVGDSEIENVSIGIYVYARSDSTDKATLNITGSGSLDASGSSNGILVQSNSGDATLTIQDTDVTAANSSSSGNGVTVQAGSSSSSSASLSVDGGSLTATGIGTNGVGIRFSFGGDTVSGTPSLTVSDNTIVRANGGIRAGAGNSAKDVTPTDGSTGIVFNGNTGTVYGNVTLLEDLTIGEDESLNIPSGASLDTNGKTLTVDGGELTGNIPTNGVVYKVTGVTLSETNLTLDVGGTAALTATVKPDNATDQAVTWSSAPDGIVAITPDATDSKRATITATGTGTAAITATVDGKSAICSVTVNAAATAPSITTQPQNTTVTEGQTASFSVAAAGRGTLTYQWQENTNNGTAWTDISGADSAAYTIENTTTGMNGYQYRCVVTNSVGTVTSRAGTLTVTAAAVPVTGVSLNKTGTSLYVGGTETLTATITPSTATNQNVTWESSDTSVATVRNGVVTAVGAGAAVITPPRTAA